jgi:hypothetical protein
MATLTSLLGTGVFFGGWGGEGAWGGFLSGTGAAEGGGLATGGGEGTGAGLTGGGGGAGGAGSGLFSISKKSEVTAIGTGSGGVVWGGGLFPVSRRKKKTCPHFPQRTFDPCGVIFAGSVLKTAEQRSHVMLIHILDLDDTCLRCRGKTLTHLGSLPTVAG